MGQFIQIKMSVLMNFQSISGKQIMRGYSKRLWGLCNSSSWPDFPHLNLSGTDDKDIIARFLSSQFSLKTRMSRLSFLSF